MNIWIYEYMSQARASRASRPLLSSPNTAARRSGSAIHPVWLDRTSETAQRWVASLDTPAEKPR